MARIEFVRGIKEEVVPDVRLTQSKKGNNGTATFFFEQPNALAPDFKEEITGMYMVDEEGELVTRDVKGKFINGQARNLEVVYVWKSDAERDRFLRFMERYAEENDLGFTKAK
jgi:photosystem II 13kDa protein